MKNLKLMLLSVIFVIAFTTGFCFGQEQSTNLKTLQRAAEGQTKWMMSNLKFDSTLFDVVYEINLKYQIKADSIHKATSFTVNYRRKQYENLTEDKNAELKSLFSRNVYDQYLYLLQSIKSSASRK